jgi:hypothetical protein
MAKKTNEKPKFTLKSRIAYFLDRMVKKSLSTQLVLLLVLVFILTVTGAFTASLFSRRSFTSLLWWSFLRIVDPGYLGEDKNFGERFVSVSIIISGLVTFGLLISILSSAFQERLESIKKGHRPVLETDHSIILGWGSMVYSIIDDLLSSQPVNSKKKPKSIVVMSDRKRTHME